MRHTVTLHNASAGHTAYVNLWTWLKPLLLAGHKVHVEAKTATRSSQQNRRMWAMLTDVSNQVIWHGQKLSPEDWKTMFTASLRAQRAVPGLDGGFVVIGESTSKMTVAEMGDLMTLMEAWGAQNDVRFTAPEDVM